MSNDVTIHSNPLRKTHHLEMAESAQVGVGELSHLFDYEPLLRGFPAAADAAELGSLEFGTKKMKAPLWVSSMTGGTGKAGHINRNLALAAKEYGLGLGLGSCRPLMAGDEYFKDFHLRAVAGDEVVIFANFGVAQIEQAIESQGTGKVLEILKRLEVDGVFIHINPLQEWFQEEGDRWFRSPLDIIADFKELADKQGLFLGVKEVGQGMGPKSLEALWGMEVDVIEFAAFGGTNFSRLEAMRESKASKLKEILKPAGLCFVGHSASEMVRHVNCLIEKKGSVAPRIIISGGVHSSLVGYYLLENLKAAGAFGMAKPFLEYAAQDLDSLFAFVEGQLEQFKMAKRFLKARPLA
jgi:isopentenyl-diphosphate delta-isomerase